MHNGWEGPSQNERSFRGVYRPALQSVPRGGGVSKNSMTYFMDSPLCAEKSWYNVTQCPIIECSSDFCNLLFKCYVRPSVCLKFDFCVSRNIEIETQFFLHVSHRHIRMCSIVFNLFSFKPLQWNRSTEFDLLKLIYGQLL